MKTKKNLVSVTLVFILFLVLSLYGCGNSEESMLTVDGKQVEVAYVVKIDGKKVTLDEYRYYFLNLKKSYDLGNDAVWTQENTLDMLKIDALESIKESYAVWNLSEKNGLELEKEDRKTIDENIDSQIETYGGKEKYQEVLKENYMTEDFYKFLWETSIIYEKLNNYYFDEGGEYYRANSSDQENAAKLKELVQSEMEKLKVEYGPQYDLITTKTLI